MSLGKPPRLERVFQKYDPPIYFVKLCTAKRERILANEIVQATLIQYGEAGIVRHVSLGRFVIMPDHIDLFVAESHDFNLGIWVRGLKRAISAAIGGEVVAAVRPRRQRDSVGDAPPGLPPVTAAATTAEAAATKGTAAAATQTAAAIMQAPAKTHAAASGTPPPAASSIWQRGFFDHLIRSNESYAQKWDYVRENPVRAGLVAAREDWAFQGETVAIQRD